MCAGISILFLFYDFGCCQRWSMFFPLLSRFGFQTNANAEIKFKEMGRWANFGDCLASGGNTLLIICRRSIISFIVPRSFSFSLHLFVFYSHSNLPHFHHFLVAILLLFFGCCSPIIMTSIRLLCYYYLFYFLFAFN